jgi:hypothetical protein
VRLKIFDFFILGFAAAITVYSGMSIYGGSASSVHLTVRGEDGSWIYPMDKNESFEISGPLGITTVELKGGNVRVISSPCTNQSCVAAGTIHGNGQWIACLPNGVFLSIEGSDSSGEAGSVDALAW